MLFNWQVNFATALIATIRMERDTVIVLGKPGSFLTAAPRTVKVLQQMC